MARYDERKMAALLADPGIVRNRLKIRGGRRQRQGSSSKCRTSSAASTPTSGASWMAGRVRNRWRRMADVPARTAQSDAMSKDLARRGFRFVGSTICYAFMQATGMVNDHLVSCFRHAEL